MAVAEELFNPEGRAGDPFRSVEDALETAACISVARWLDDNRPEALAVEFDGSGREVWLIRVLALVDGEPTLRPVERGDDPHLWDRVEESWLLLLSIGRAVRRVVSADEARHWNRD